jgi:hypothetical protein
VKAQISLFPHALSDVALERHNCSGVQAAKMGVAHVVETYRVPWRALAEEQSKLNSTG